MSEFVPSGLDPKVLMELVKNSPSVSKQFIFSSQKQHFIAVAGWMKACNIRSGNIQNPVGLLHKHFLTWAKTHGEHPMHVKMFGRFLGKVFRSKRTDASLVYLLNQKVENEEEKTLGS